MEQEVKPWEKVRVKRILEIFGGRVVKISTVNVRRDINAKDEIQRQC